MIALLTDWAAKPPALRASSVAAWKRKRAAAFSDEIWELHHVISNPASHAAEVKMAKRQLLRRLEKSLRIVVSKESRRRATRSHRFAENTRAAAVTTP